MIELEGATRTFTRGTEEIPVLRSVDLHVAAGESVAVVGRSGSGKSTLMNVLGLLDRPTAGRYRLAGQPVEDLSEADRTSLRSQTLGFVFQAFHLIESRSVRANIELGLVHARVPRRQRRELVDRALGRVGLEHRADFPAANLSGGEKQRAAVARAIAGSKRLLLCDEPTGNLDSATSRSIVDLLLEQARTGLAVVIVTHDLAVADRCDRVLSLQDGVLRERPAAHPTHPC